MSRTPGPAHERQAPTTRHDATRRNRARHAPRDTPAAPLRPQEVLTPCEPPDAGRLHGPRTGPPVAPPAPDHHEDAGRFSGAAGSEPRSGDATSAAAPPHPHLGAESRARRSRTGQWHEQPARGALQGRIYCANKTVIQKKSWQQRGYVSQFIVTIARVSSGLPVLNGLNPTD